jgi:hypothetical protein
MEKFSIDFFELAFLAEACIPPRPIARSMFWDRLINEIYDELSKDERIRLFEWIPRNPCFNLENEDCQLFFARFNPENQYEVTYIYEGEKKVIECFMLNERYYTTKNISIYEKYITKVEKIQYL